MADHALGAADRQLAGVVAEDLLDRLGLRRVAQLRAGAVGVDVLNVLRVDLRVAQGHAHGHRRSRSGRMRRGDVVGVGRAADAQQLGVDGRPAACGRVPALPRSRMPAPSLRTKPSRSLSNGRLAPCGSSLRVDRARADDEAAQAHRRDAGLRAAGDHHVGLVVLDGAQGVADGVGGRGAGRRDGGVGAARPELNGDVARRRVGDHFRDDERADPAGPPCIRRACCSSNSLRPPMPLPMMTPQR